jgi:hydrogenase-4 component F
MVLGIGLGGAGVFAALLHTVNNALTKGVLFLAAGNIHRAYESKRLEDVTGALRRLPVSAGLFLAGFFAITGSPPFGPFVSELSVLLAAVDGGRWWIAAAYLALLAIIFVGMGATVLAVVQGAPPESEARTIRETWLKTVPIAASLALVLVMGVWIPGPVARLLHEAARLMGGS